METYFSQENKRATNRGRKWSDDDLNKLKTMYMNGIDITEIASNLQKTYESIKQALKIIIVKSGESIENVAKIYNKEISEIHELLSSTNNTKNISFNANIDTEISQLERENTLLKLKVENIKLKIELKNLLKTSNDSNYDNKYNSVD